LSSKLRKKFAEGALAVLLATVLALLARMRDVNFELRKQLALGRRKRPPSETMQRLQMELSFWDAVAADDSKLPAQTPNKKPKKRGPRTAHPHGRTKQPEHLSRIPVPHHVEAEQHICPCCNAETAPVKFIVRERLDVVPARFVVRQDLMEVRACQCPASAGT
jgi:hypothetical protein